MHPTFFIQLAKIRTRELERQAEHQRIHQRRRRWLARTGR
jgi:hypothetical protein